MQSTTDFIAIVRKNEAIYDTTNADYKNMERKSFAWKNVAEEAELTVEECKRKWKNLRDSYTKYLRSFRTGSKTSRKYQFWAHAENMDFLKPFQGPIRSQPKVEKNYEFTADEYNIDHHIPKVENNCCLSPDIYEKYLPHEEIINNVVNDDPTVMVVTPQIYKNDEKLSPTTGLNYEQQLTYPKSYKTKRNMLNKMSPTFKFSDLDSNSLFFLSLAKSVKSMPKKYQAKVKINCMKIVNEAELDLEASSYKNIYMQNQKTNNTNFNYNQNEEQEHEQIAGENSEHFLYVMSPSRVEAMIDISSDDDIMDF